jgi:PD-(D/E)XK nuclease superfamily
MWSYSSLSEMAECPRRWMLARAHYPSVWDRDGYPSRPSPAALAGTVTHRALEIVLAALQSHRCESAVDPRAVQALRDIGGFSKLIENTIDRELDALAHNPRSQRQLGPIRERLVAEIPAIRERIQAAVSRMRLYPIAEGTRATDAGSARGPLAPGSHAEVELSCEELRLRGRADLVAISREGCAITDYKTGSSSESHVDQLRLYALLWSRDEEMNPSRLPVQELVLAYTGNDLGVDPPSPDELDTLAATLAEQIEQAEANVSHPPAPALPAPQMCRYCAVRHLCEEYWDTAAALLPVPPPGAARFVDCEASVARRNGPRSWFLSLGAENAGVLLRTMTEDPGFNAGDSVRLLGLALWLDKESGEPVLAMTSFSEVFVLRGLAREPGIMVSLA